MAQALSSVDTLLAPFVKVDDLSYHEVKQCIQSLVFGLNTPSRWGCVPITTQIATPGGFKYYNELNTGDTIYTFVDGKLKTAKLNNIIVKKNESGKLHKYCGNNYVQTVTPEHRCIICLEDGGFRIIRSEAIKKFLSENQTIYMPVGVVDNDGTISITDNQCIKIDSVDVLDYSEMVWCPSTDDGTAIYRDIDGNTFISGNCQPVFSNFTIDWVVPDDLAEMNCIVGGEEQNFKYKDCKREMDMINKAFLEVMVEGDADGRSFSYPILTYSITKDFDWDEESVNNKLLFEMTAKYGIPYFSNYINSDMKPSDSRSMCPMHKDTCVTVKDNKVIMSDRIEHIYEMFGENLIDVLTPNGWRKGKPIKVENQKTYKITMKNGLSVSLGENHLQPTKDNGTLLTRDLKVGMSIPYVDKQHLGVFLITDDVEKLKIKYSEIESIEQIKYDDILYCFEIDDEDHLFIICNGIITHNCRLRLDLRELRRKNGGYFGSGDGTGSVGVTTINMPRLAYLSENEEDFYRRLENLMNICSRSLEIKRRVVTQLLQDGLYPYTKRYVKHFDNHFSTIATNGMNEMCLNAKWIKDDIASERGYQFAKDVLEFMRNKLSDYQEQTGNLYNLESAPAESVCHRFALHDKRDFPDIITAGDNTDGAPYYTNSSNLPVGYTDDIFEALDHQDELQTKYTGGTVFHAFLGERLPNWKSAMMLTKKIAENYRLPYFTFSPTYSICKNHGYLVGEQWKCPHCGEPTEVYSRVTGYYRAVQNFNDGKAHEFKDRKEYKITEDSLKSNTAVVENDTVNTTKETQVYELDKPVLITTETCPNCKIVKEYIKEFDFDCDVIIANEHLDFVRSLNINQAPTLVVPDGDGNIRLIANASNIRKYLEENS